MLDLRGCDYDLSGSWRNAAGGEGAPEAVAIPVSVEFDEAEKAFVFFEGGDVLRVPLATNPQHMRAVSYAAWVKVPRKPQNLAWLMSQHPDYGWSRALALNDYRLGNVSISTSRYWDSGLGPVPVQEWVHVVGVWDAGAECTAYLNGRRGDSTSANNGKGADVDEELVIGGRAPYDSAHNAAVLVADVSVYDRALGHDEVRHLHAVGRATAVLAPSAVDCDLVGRRPSRVPRTLSGQPYVRRAQTWDESTGVFWCDSGVNAYEIPDGEEWQTRFREALKVAQGEVKQSNRLQRYSGTPSPLQMVMGEGGMAVEPSESAIAGAGEFAAAAQEHQRQRVLGRHVSDAPTPAADAVGAAERQRRTLARFPSDPDKRAARAAHTDALRQMRKGPGVQRLVHGRAIALFRFGGRVFAVDAACPHQGARLSDGEVGDIEDMVLGKRYFVRCKVHKYQFDLTSGVVREGVCPPLQVYRTRIRQDDAQSAIVEVGFENLGEEYFRALDDSDVDF